MMTIASKYMATLTMKMGSNLTCPAPGTWVMGTVSDGVREYRPRDFSKRQHCLRGQRAAKVKGKEVRSG